MAWAQDTGEQGATSRTDVLRDSPPMFESRLLDACSRVHPLVPVIIFVPGIGLLGAWRLLMVRRPPRIGLVIG
jgi:hypothetical protein